MRRLGKCILNYIDQLCCLTIFFCWHLSFVSGHLIWPSNGFHNLLLSSHSPEAEQPVNLQHTSYIYFWQNENETYATHHRQSTSNWNPVTHEHLLPDTHTPPLNHQHYPGGIFHKQLNHTLSSVPTPLSRFLSTGNPKHWSRELHWLRQVLDASTNHPSPWPETCFSENAERRHVSLKSH